MDGFDARHVMATRIAREWDDQRTTPDWREPAEQAAEPLAPSVLPFPGPAARPPATAAPPPAA